jgi:hypothetical protein
MWDAIKYVTGFASLAAFLSAGVFGYLNYRAWQKTKWMGQIPENDKARALDALLDRFHVDTTSLTREQKFEIAMAQIKNARRNYSMLLGLFALITILLAGLWFIFLRQDKLAPPMSTFEGFVVFKDSRQTGKAGAPVSEAEVQIRGTELRAKTDANGKFTITNVPSTVSLVEVVINRGGRSYTLETKDFPDKVFRIPPDANVVKSKEHYIQSQDWKMLLDGCNAPENSKYQRTAQFSMTKDVQQEDGYSDLLLRVWCDDPIDIISARNLQPGIKIRDPDDYTKAQKWQFPIKEGAVHVSVSLCLGTIANPSTLSKADVQATYWFEKVE